MDPPNVIGGGSFLTEMITMAGGRNVFADVGQPSATVSIESIAARDPEVILMLGATELPDLARRPEWQVVRAVRERRFVPIAGSEFSWPSPRAFEAVAALRAAFAERTR
jgi:ABC-type Fe3+-hydroxamate transport system substrate-binding protein